MHGGLAPAFNADLCIPREEGRKCLLGLDGHQLGVSATAISTAVIDRSCPTSYYSLETSQDPRPLDWR